MTARKFAQKLLLKAEQDLLVLEKLKTESGIANEVLGFHAQQAAKKILKAVLAAQSVRFPFTHRLTELIDAIKSEGLSFPQPLEEVRYLTPFAVEFRYNFLGDDDEDFDIFTTIALLETLHQWAIPLIKTKHNAE